MRVIKITQEQHDFLIDKSFDGFGKINPMIDIHDNYVVSETVYWFFAGLFHLEELPEELMCTPVFIEYEPKPLLNIDLLNI